MTFANPSITDDDRSHEAGSGARLSLIGRLVDRALPALQAGRLQLVLPNGEAIERRGRDPGPDAALCAHRWRALWRIMLDGDDGFADGYVDGDWSSPELGLLLDLLMRNEAALTRQAESSKLRLARNHLMHWLRANTRRGSRRNIAAHYDLGNDFFRPWLDSGMNYSSGIFNGGDTLEAAQDTKLDRIAALLALSGGERILEIGCGWGALAERLIRRFGATVNGVTLSTEQLDYARMRLAHEADQQRADMRLLDYRDVQGCFDRIVSIEMIEAVGERYWPTYFAKIHNSLRKGGAAVLQAITIAEDRFAAYRKRPDFIQRYIFPGGMLPTPSIIAREASRAGLKLVHHEMFGDSYAKTLREWRDRFLHAWPSIQKLGFDDRFRRMWEYYLAYCEVGFRTAAVDVGFFKLEHDAPA
jgi:cyclopropane-fatty-acyl-phospholipid synthase